MNYRRKYTEIAVSMLILAVASGSLLLFGKASRKILPTLKLEQIAQPHEAFRAWEKFGTHGRVLILLDRYLNAEEVERGTFDFTPEEFTGSFSIDGLCQAINSDDYGIGAVTCTLNGLNVFLRTQDLYPVWKRMKKDIVIPPETFGKIRHVRGKADRFERLPAEWQQDIIEFNRRLLELTYPAVTPKKSLWAFVGSDNYVHKAIEEGYVRKIYHVVPESAWPEVEKTLNAYQMVTFSSGSFTMSIEGMTQVVILRLQDLPSFSEEVLLNINGLYWSSSELNILADRFRQGRIKSDLITFSGPVSDEMLAAFRGPG